MQVSLEIIIFFVTLVFCCCFPCVFFCPPHVFTVHDKKQKKNDTNGSQKRYIMLRFGLFIKMNAVRCYIFNTYFNRSRKSFLYFNNDESVRFYSLFQIVVSQKEKIINDIAFHIPKYY